VAARPAPASRDVHAHSAARRQRLWRQPAEDQQIAQAQPQGSQPQQQASTPPQPRADSGDRVKASPLARRLAEQKGIDLSTLTGSGPAAASSRPTSMAPPPKRLRQRPAPAPPERAPHSVAAASPRLPLPRHHPIPDIPHEAAKLSNIRKTIARRLTESKQQVPHIYLTLDIRLDALLKLRTELNASLEARGVKLSVNDFMIKALAVALLAEPKCNVMYTPSELITFKRADISVAVSTPTGLITPIIVDAGAKSLSATRPR
jgi:pyruvate dehydrogenase E2 component (dihydrolipoamide acetyltransferase)